MLCLLELVIRVLQSRRGVEGHSSLPWKDILFSDFLDGHGSYSIVVCDQVAPMSSGASLVRAPVQPRTSLRFPEVPSSGVQAKEKVLDKALPAEL